MKTINITRLRTRLKETLDDVAESNEVVIVSRNNDKNVAIISLKEYNSLRETLYLLESKNNAERLSRAIERDKNNLLKRSNQLTQ